MQSSVISTLLAIPCLVVFSPEAAKIPQKPANAVEPPHSVILHFKKREVEIRVTLHKIPEKFVNIVPLGEKFHVDSVGWTKKVWLDVTYPQQAKVDTDRGQAVLDAGMLQVTLPIKECIDKETGKLVKFNKHGDIVVEKVQKKAPKQEKPAAKQAEPEAKPTKTKAKAKESPKPKKEQEPVVESADSEEANEQNEDSDAMDVSEEAPVLQAQKLKKRKIPVSQMTPEQLAEKKMRQEKKKPVEKSSALAIIDQLAAVEDKKRSDRLAHEAQRDAHFEEKNRMREERKKMKLERQKEAAKKALAERKKLLKLKKQQEQDMQAGADDSVDEQPAPVSEKPKKRKVSFEEGASKKKKAKTN